MSIVTYYPRFTVIEAAEVEKEALRYGKSPEDFLRQLAGLDKFPSQTPGRSGRPPLPQEVHLKREAEKAELRRLRKYVTSTASARRGLSGELDPPTEGKLRAAKQLLKEYDETGSSIIGLWESRTRELIGKVVDERTPKTPPAVPPADDKANLSAGTSRRNAKHGGNR